MSSIKLLGLVVLFCVLSCAPPVRSGDISTSLLFAEQLQQHYEQYHENSITTRRFRLSDIQPIIDQLPAAFTVSEAGRSIQGRKLNRVEWGSGPVQVLLWSQMHGDEPTATAALLDIFHWLEASGDGMDEIRDRLQQELSLTFLPMLNPDGAELYRRRNALNVDLNRDALRLQSPEARLLKNERDRLEADWGFNLHDQSIYYGVGFPAERGAAVSILAPAFDWDKTVDAKREDAMQMIALMNQQWQKTAPGGVGRYNDDFEPRAFGDNLQKWGTRTILIESGGWPGDPEKQEIRKMNFCGILLALHAIATQSFEAVSTDEYWAIPENKYNALFDLVLREVRVEAAGEGPFTIDIGIRRPERVVPATNDNYYRDGIIHDLGDLHTFLGIENFAGTGVIARPGQTYPAPLTMAELRQRTTASFHDQGYTSVQLLDWQPHFQLEYQELRLLAEGQIAGSQISPGQSTDLLLYRNDELIGVVVLGALRDLSQ
ncbi:MAG: M14 family zinc carboxypeptidase [Bacteroidota bacterium]